MPFETGLYGQQERGDHLALLADTNRFDDVHSEGVGYRVPTEDEYLVKMRDCVVAEVVAARNERQLLAGYETLRGRCQGDISPRDYLEAIGLSYAAQVQALAFLGLVAEEMRRDGYHQGVVYRNLTRCVPAAYEHIKTMRDGKYPKAPTPKSRIKGAPQLYSLERHPAQFGTTTVFRKK